MEMLPLNITANATANATVNATANATANATVNATVNATSEFPPIADDGPSEQRLIDFTDSFQNLFVEYGL